MALPYTFLIQKEREGITKNLTVSSLAAYGFAVSSATWPDEETQELFTREWPGEDGEDVYIPQGGLKLKAFDLSVTFIYKGEMNTARKAYEQFRDFLIGRTDGNAKMSIFDPYWKRGYTGVHLKKCSNMRSGRSDIDEVYVFDATFRITNPMSTVILNYVESVPSL